MKFNDYLFAIKASVQSNTLNKIIYFSGFDKDLNESEVRAVINLADDRLNEMKRARAAERARMRNRDIGRIQAYR